MSWPIARMGWMLRASLVAYLASIGAEESP